MRELTFNEQSLVAGSLPTLCDALVIDDFIIGGALIGLGWSLLLNKARADRNMPLYPISDCARCVANTAFSEGLKYGLMAEGTLFLANFIYHMTNASLSS